MKALLSLLALTACASAASAPVRRPLTVVKGSSWPDPRFYAAVEKLVATNPNFAKLKGSFECDTCISFAEDALDDLIKALLGGIPGTCGALCSTALGGWEAEVCDLLCSVVGLDEFIKLLETADISPVWFCLELYACPSTTCTGSQCAQVQSFLASPSTAGPPGKIDFSFNLVFASGVGTVTTTVNLQELRGDGQWGSDGENLIVAPSPGTGYPMALPSHLEVTDGNGDPPECPTPGRYNATAVVCLGACGDTFKNSGPIIAQASVPVIITAGDGCMGSGNGKIKVTIKPDF